MAQQCLAAHQIKALILERQGLGDALDVAAAVRETKLAGALCGVRDPTRIALDADDSRLSGKDLHEGRRAMSESSADVERRPDPLQFKAGCRTGTRRRTPPPDVRPAPPVDIGRLQLRVALKRLRLRPGPSEAPLA